MAKSKCRKEQLDKKKRIRESSIKPEDSTYGRKLKKRRRERREQQEKEDRGI